MSSLKLLLADDDIDDRMLFEEAFLEVASGDTLHTVKDGKELLNYLINSQSQLPDLIFLDLNMPILNGHQCLEEIRRNSGMKDIFIVINTTSVSPKEVDLVYENGANLFFIKPDSFEELKKSIKLILNINFKEFMKTRPRDKFIFRMELFEKEVE